MKSFAEGFAPTGFPALLRALVGALRVPGAFVLTFVVLIGIASETGPSYAHDRDSLPLPSTHASHITTVSYPPSSLTSADTSRADSRAAPAAGVAAETGSAVGREITTYYPPNRG